MTKLFLSIGSINAMLAVMLGAFGAHGLKSRLSAEMMEIFHTAVQYHFIHALGLLAIGLVAYHLPESAWIRWSGWLLLAGIVIFSGSLYLLSISGVRWLGAVTPIGGLAFIAGWLLLTIGVLKGF